MNLEFVWVSTLLPLSALYVYYSTAFPTVSGGDSGELLTVVCNHGVAHPPVSVRVMSSVTMLAPLHTECAFAGLSFVDMALDRLLQSLRAPL
jgi:hypothetical protein